MKVALVCDWYAPRIGGLEMQMRDLARELTTHGHEVEVLTSTRGEPEVDGIRVHRLNIPLLPFFRIMYQSGSVSALERVLVDGRFDVIHGHSAFSSLACAATFVGHKHRIPSVLTEHSVLKGTGGALLSAVNRIYPWSTWPDVITAVSTYVAKEMERVSRREIVVLPNGVTPDEWTRSDPSPNEPLRITSVMRLFKRKRPIDIVRAMPRVYARLPASVPRPIFTLVGDGSERARVEKEAVRLGVREHLEVLGWQPRPEVKKVLARSSIFILPTSKEALSIATLEALSAGVPAVAMSHGGVGDIIHHGREGFLAKDFDEFVDYIVQLVTDSDLRARMSAATHATAARFSWETVLAQHLEVYRLAETRCQKGSSSNAIAA